LEGIVELSAYLRLVRAHWVVIVSATLLGAALAVGWTAIQPRVYSADASGIITTGVSQDLGSALVGDNYAKSRAKSYLDVAKSRSVATFAINALGLKISPEKLVSEITVTNPVDTALLRVSARSSTPEGARDLAETWMSGMIAQVSALENSGSSSEDERPSTENGAETSAESAAPEALGPSIVRLQTLDSAIVPTSPTSPNGKLAVAIGILIGLVLGIVYAFVRRALDRRIRSIEMVEKEFGLAVVGTIPFHRTFTDSNRLIAAASASGQSSKNTDDDSVAEALRELRTNLQFMDVDDPPRIIVITSSLPGDGKSTITANLATTIAASGQPVVIVDGDLRRPTVATAFGLLPGVGLTDVLVGRAEIHDVLQEWGDTGHLHVMGAGSLPPNPSELLGSKAMKSLLDDLAERAIVLIDAPPLIPVTDAAILTALSDGALIVASVGKTSIDALGKSLQNIERVKGRALGLILNRIRRTGPDSAYYGYQYKGDYRARGVVEPESHPQPVEASNLTRRATYRESVRRGGAQTDGVRSARPPGDVRDPLKSAN
jgi:capsular exopolysaccharide synthesis family protein